jgi:hypothetical protein
VIIVAAAGWAACGPSGVIAVLAASGALTRLAPRQALARGDGGCL